MTNQAENDFDALIAGTIHDTARLETVLSKINRLLTERGLQVSVDFVGMAQNVQHNLTDVQAQSRIFTEKIDQLEALLQTFTLVTLSLDLEQVLQQVIDTVVRLIGAERVYLMMRDHQTGELNILIARNWHQEALSESDIFFSHNVVQMTLDRGEPILTTNAKNDTRLKHYESVMGQDMRSILCVPLKMRGEIVGVLYADNRVSQHLFKPESLPLLAAFGMQAAIAIEHAQTFSEMKRDLDRALSEIQHLQIQIDQQRVQAQVDEIVETEYFRELADAARSMRRRYTAISDEDEGA